MHWGATSQDVIDTAAMLALRAGIDALLADLDRAIRALRQQHPARIVVAVPVAAPETCDALRAEVDEVVCALTPEPFLAVGFWYEDFPELRGNTESGN